MIDCHQLASDRLFRLTPARLLRTPADSTGPPTLRSRPDVHPFIPMEFDDMLLKDKVAVITGGAGINGLGHATARQMAAHGAKVVILDLARAEPAAAAARLGEGHL